MNTIETFSQYLRYQFELIAQSEQNNQVVLVFFIILSVVLVLFLTRLLLRIVLSSVEPSVLIELIPPATTEKTSYTTQQLFSVIHNLGKQRSFLGKVVGKRITFSCEIASTHNEGIRYLLKTSPRYVNNLKRSLLAYLPQVRVSVVNEYLPKELQHSCRIVEFTQTRPFVYSLKKQNTLEEHDPVAYITGMMTKLSSDELISFQIVLSPSGTKSIPDIKRKIIRGEDVLDHIDTRLSFISLPIKLIQSVLSVFRWSVVTIINDLSSVKQHDYLASSLTTNKRIVSVFEQQAVKFVEDKIDQPLFDVQLRLLVVVNNKTDLNERINGFLSSLGVFSVPNYQALRKRPSFHYNFFNQVLFYNFRKRLLSLVLNSSLTVLSVSEVSDMYHFPFMDVTQTENIVKVHSKELPAPLSLKQINDFDVTFAKNNYGGSTTMIGLTQDERRRHMYVIGATGSGKTTMLLSMIEQDIKHGKGVCVVDPHGDLAETIIDCIPTDRINDLIYFNPYDIKYPIGVNLLELTPGLDEDDALIEKEFIAESVISLFRKMFSDSGSGHPHRIEYILRNTIHTAFTVENPTLFTIFELLNNPSFQKKTVQNLRDENLKNFWKYEFGKAGDYQQVKMTAPVTSRIGRFLFSPSAKRILEQEKSTINFDEILDSNKLLICNLSKGSIGEDTSEVMGIMILNKIQLAALKRSRREKKLRNDYYLYVDEFQNFATPSFVQMLSESRKYGLNLTIAEQSTSQQNDRNLTHVILANVGTVVGFRSANPIDEDLLLRQFSPYVDKGEIANLEAYHFYMKTSALHPEEPFSGETMPLNLLINKEFRQRLIQASREHHATLYTPKNAVKNIEEKKTKQKKKEDAPATQQSIFPEG